LAKFTKLFEGYRDSFSFGSKLFMDCRGQPYQHLQKVVTIANPQIAGNGYPVLQ
jgi:hypothetical protein